VELPEGQDAEGKTGESVGDATPGARLGGV
jgi:hypothetical protein